MSFPLIFLQIEFFILVFKKKYNIKMDLCTKFRLIFESYFDFAKRELTTGINACY